MAKKGRRQVSIDEGRALANSHDAFFFEISSKEIEDWGEPFDMVIKRVVTTTGFVEAVTATPAAGDKAPVDTSPPRRSIFGLLWPLIFGS